MIPVRLYVPMKSGRTRVSLLASRPFVTIRNGLLAGMTALAVRLLLRSLRYEVEGWERAKLEGWYGRGVIFAFWHNSLMIPLGHESRRNCRAVMSTGRDGEFAARVVRRFGVGSVRGSTSRGGAPLLLELLRRSERGAIFAVTPDGPRGPRYRFQPGTAYLASRTGLPVVPVGMALSRTWKLRSWDRFRIPRPFARAVMVFGRPEHLSPDLDRGKLEASRVHLEDTLHRLSREAARKAGCAWPD